MLDFNAYEQDFDLDLDTEHAEDYEEGYFDPSYICEASEVEGLTEQDFVTETATLTRELDINFLVQQLDSPFRRLEPIRVTVKAVVGIELAQGWVSYISDIETLTVDFASGEARVYTRADMDDDTYGSDVETLFCMFYGDLQELAECVRQSPKVATKLRELGYWV